MLRRREAGVVLVVLAVGTACSGTTDPGFVPVVDARLTVVRPAAWRTPTTVEKPWAVGFRLAPDSVEQIQVSGDFGDYVTAAEAGGSLVGVGQVGLQGFTVVQTRDLEIKNATSAQAVRYTITDNHGSQVSGEWIVAVRWPERQSVAVSVLTPRFDPELERSVIDSVRFAS
ncbi:MAG: hypothetical protein ACRYG2_05985 [Janthinobacterium lividum]